MICAPSSSRASLRKLLTVACVPTGINTGVSIGPCGVVRRPRRAPAASVFDTSNEKFTHRVYQEKSGDSAQEKDHAKPVKKTMNASAMPTEIPSDFPNGNFFGSAAEKPMATRMSAHIPNRSKKASGTVCQGATLLAKITAGLEARKLSGSIEAG